MRTLYAFSLAGCVYSFYKKQWVFGVIFFVMAVFFAIQEGYGL